MRTDRARIARDAGETRRHFRHLAIMLDFPQAKSVSINLSDQTHLLRLRIANALLDACRQEVRHHVALALDEAVGPFSAKQHSASHLDFYVTARLRRVCRNDLDEVPVGRLGDVYAAGYNVSKRYKTQNPERGKEKERSKDRLRKTSEW